jgi:opacity protein-like surface antigen
MVCIEEIGMKKILLAALMAGVATSAFAADLPTRKAPPAPAPMYVVPAFTWTGFYVGVNGGYAVGNGGGGFGNVDGGMAAPPPATTTSSARSCWALRVIGIGPT